MGVRIEAVVGAEHADERVLAVRCLEQDLGKSIDKHLLLRRRVGLQYLASKMTWVRFELRQ